VGGHSGGVGIVEGGEVSGPEVVVVGGDADGRQDGVALHSKVSMSNPHP